MFGVGRQKLRDYLKPEIHSFLIYFNAVLATLATVLLYS